MSLEQIIKDNEKLIRSKFQNGNITGLVEWFSSTFWDDLSREDMGRIELDLRKLLGLPNS